MSTTKTMRTVVAAALLCAAVGVAFDAQPAHAAALDSACGSEVWNNGNSDYYLAENSCWNPGGLDITVVVFPNDPVWDANLYVELVYQGDGNLVEYCKAGPTNAPIHQTVLWASNSNGSSGGSSSRLAMQSDGNLVVYNASDHPVFASGTNNHPTDYAALQTDGNLVIYNGNGAALWSTRTNGKCG